jgi:hypothetical protein
MTKHLQPEQSMGEYHPDERVRARRARIRIARDREASDDAPPPKVDAATVTVALDTWQEVMRLAKIARELDQGTGIQKSSLTDDSPATDPQQELDPLIASEPVNLERHRIAATIAALRKRAVLPCR